MAHRPGHPPQPLSLAGAVQQNGNSFSQTGGPVSLADAQQSLGINPALSSLSVVGNSPQELQNRQNTLGQINSARDQLRVNRLGKIANRPGLAGDAARTELQNLGVLPNLSQAAQINNFADTLQQQRQRDQVISSNLADASNRRSTQQLLLSKIQRGNISDLKEDQQAAGLAAALLPTFTQQTPQLDVPDLQTQGLASGEVLAAQQAEANRQTQREIAEGRNAASLAGAELGAASRLGVAELQNQGLASQAALTSARETAKLGVKDQFDVEEARRGALDTFNILDKLEMLSSRTGPTANLAGIAGGTPLGSIGLGDESAANRAQFNALASNLVLAAADSLSGVLSDKDMELLRETAPQFGNSTTANQEIIKNMRDLITRRLSERGIDIENIEARIQTAQQSDPDVTPANVRAGAAELGISESEFLRRLGF